MTFNTLLFLGFPISSDFASRLNCTPEPILHSFIQDHPDYLQKIEHQGMEYIGKSLEFPVDTRLLELIEANIYSLLRRLVADYSYETTPLCLIGYETAK